MKKKLYWYTINGVEFGVIQVIKVFRNKKRLVLKKADFGIEPESAFLSPTGICNSYKLYIPL